MVIFQVLSFPYSDTMQKKIKPEKKIVFDERELQDIYREQEGYMGKDG